MSLTFFPQFRILTFERLQSTNDTAMERLKRGEAMNGDIIMAGYQLAGRGQALNSWYSSEGNNLLVSFTCKDIQLNASHLPMLNILVSLALYNTVSTYFPNTTAIKWPNDILVNEQKIAGILIETSIQAEFVKNAVIGIGLNVNEELFPRDLPNACSYYTLSHTYFNLDTILKVLMEQLDMQLSKLKHYSFDKLKRDYESVLFGMGVKRYFRSSGKNFEGIIRGVNSSGQLCVETAKKIETFNTKEITFDFGKH